MNLNTGKRRFSVEESAKTLTDGMCLCCGQFNCRMVEHKPRNKPQMLKPAATEVKVVGTTTGSEEC